MEEEPVDRIADIGKRKESFAVAWRLQDCYKRDAIPPVDPSPMRERSAAELPKSRSIHRPMRGEFVWPPRFEGLRSMVAWALLIEDG